jgi:hypothetical protein
MVSSPRTLNLSGKLDKPMTKLASLIARHQ